MATATQVSQFANQYGSYAQTAGADLGVNPGIILAQWGLETGYGTQMSGVNNLGNITNSDGTFANYSSISQFLSAFVSNVATHPGAVNAGLSSSQYAQGLASGGNGSYFGSQTPTSYAAGLTGAENTLQTDATSVFDTIIGLLPGNNSTASVGSNPSTTATGSSTSPTSGTQTTTSGSGSSACSGVSAIFNYSCWANFAGNISLIVIAIVIFLGIILLVAESGGGKGGGTRYVPAAA
jgi:hypothetical protein